jgi:hypothetical protein
MTVKLTWEEELAFDALIKKTVACRYEDEVERCEDPRGRWPDCFCPTDEEHVRELLTELWDERLTPNKIDQICKELIADGLDTYEQWPLGWCEEEEDDKEERAWRLQDYEAELKEQAEKAKRPPHPAEPDDTSPTP